MIRLEAVGVGISVSPSSIVDVAAGGSGLGLRFSLNVSGFDLDVRRSGREADDGGVVKREVPSSICPRGPRVDSSNIHADTWAVEKAGEVGVVICWTTISVWVRLQPGEQIPVSTWSHLVPRETPCLTVIPGRLGQREMLEAVAGNGSAPSRHFFDGQQQRRKAIVCCEQQSRIASPTA